MLEVRPGIALVTRKTRMQGLLARWATKGQARFRLKQARLQEQARSPQPVTAAMLAEADEEYGALEDEDQEYQRALATVHQSLDFDLPVQLVDREFLPNFDFSRSQVVVVLGQDGLVANAAKYVGDVPIVAVNPDPRRIDGVLLPFSVDQVRPVVAQALEGRVTTRQVTLAEVSLPDGQRMLAFNDFFIGSASHVSARYRLQIGKQAEPQSSSGIIVSTGAGSTGWFSSVLNMAGGIARWLEAPPPQPLRMKWEDRFLVWAVREPFASKSSRASLVAGRVREGEELVIESLMPSAGVIFSDGVETDFLEFNSGAIARVGVSSQRVRLVWN